MSTCLECSGSDSNQQHPSPLVTPQGLPPAPVAGYRNPGGYVPPAVPLQPCPQSDVAPVIECNDGYRFQFVAEDVEATAPCQTFVLRAPCASRWAYAGLLLRLNPFGYVEVISLNDDQITVKNITVADNSVIPVGTAIYPVPRVIDDLNPHTWVYADDPQDGSLDSCIFPVLKRVTTCDGVVYKPSFKRELCGIRVLQATTDEMNAGADIMVRVRGTNCLRLLPPPPNSMLNPLLSWSQSKNTPRWTDGTAGDRQIFAYTGAQQDLTIPGDAVRMQIECWGAGGGTTDGVGYGGGGGYSSCIVDVSPGAQYKVIVGKGSFGFAFVGDTDPGVGTRAGGGGLSGVFTGNTAVTADDYARSVCVAGGGAGGGFKLAGDVHYLGGGGNDATAAQPNMQGQNWASGNYLGTGGGGYRGGFRQKGGSGFASGDNQLITPGVNRYAVKTNVPTYQPNTGAAGQAGAVVITYFS